MTGPTVPIGSIEAEDRRPRSCETGQAARPGRAGRARLAVVVVLAALAAGCGADTAELASETAPTTEATQPASGDGDGTGAGSTETSDGATNTPTTLVVSDDETSTTDAGAEPAPTDPETLALPADAATQANALIEAETAIRDPAVPDDQAAAWGRRQQRLYRHLGRHPDWAEPVLAAIENPLLRRAVERNWTARVNLDALVAAHGAQAEVPAWRVVEPRPVDELLGYYRDGEAQWQVEWTYLAAINLIETRMGRIEGVSTAGALGPMQFLPTTWAECCDGDPTDPADAIPGAARYLTVRGAPEDMAGAIWGYNNSDRYVAAVTAYAEVMRDDALAYRGYHAWEIYFLTTEGLVHLPVGYEELESVPVAEWLADHPDRLLP